MVHVDAKILIERLTPIPCPSKFGRGPDRSPRNVIMVDQRIEAAVRANAIKVRALGQRHVQRQMAATKAAHDDNGMDFALRFAGEDEAEDIVCVPAARTIRFDRY